MKVVAEGVETRDQLSFLKGTGCDWIQGYYFSKPLPLTDYRKLLRSFPDLSVSRGSTVPSALERARVSILASEPGKGKAGEAVSAVEFSWEGMQRELERQRQYFDIVRVVNPMKASVHGQKQGECNEHACYTVWQKENRCNHCISMRALENHGRFNKLEYSANGLFFVIAQYIKVEGQECVMEMVSRLEDGYVDNVFDRDLLFMKLMIQIIQLHKKQVPVKDIVHIAVLQP